MNVEELFHYTELAEMIDEGYVRKQVHPTLPYTIFNYTEKAAYERNWNKVTLTCRGLIVDSEGEILARPFPKFFNYGEPGAPEFTLDEPVTITDKLDGSLGILYPIGDGQFAVATRGSFTSEQAIHATRVWNERYAGTFTPPADITMLFEIIYPANRIVCDYQGADDLYLLGAVEIATGQSFNFGESEAWGCAWPGPKTSFIRHPTLADALAAEPRPGKEGMVIKGAFDERRLKLKQEDYVALHRIVTGLNARTVWEHISEPGRKLLAELLEPLPEEFHPWVEQVAAQLQGEVYSIIDQAASDLTSVVGGLPEGFSRKEFALAAQAYETKKYLFLMFDERYDKVIELAWRSVRPSGDWTPTGLVHGEDTA